MFGDKQGADGQRPGHLHGRLQRHLEEPGPCPPGRLRANKENVFRARTGLEGRGVWSLRAFLTR